MRVLHARAAAMASADEEPGDDLPGLLEVLAQVPDPRNRRGKRYTLVFILAAAVACVLAGAKNFREIGDHAADLPQEVLARLGGRPHPLLRRVLAPSEKRIRTLLQQIDAAKLDELTGGWLRALAEAGRLDGLLGAIAIDGEWLRGIGDGQQVKLFAALLHEEKVIIAQHATPEDTNEITQVRELLDPVDLHNAVVTGDAAHAQRGTADYIAAGLDFPHVKRAVRIRRDGYDATGALISKEIVHAVTTLDAGRAGPADLARVARGQWGIESVHWVRHRIPGRFRHR